MQAVNNEARQLEAALAERLRRIDADASRVISDATAQIDDLQREKERKKDARFKALCDEFIRAELMQIPIRATSVESLTASNLIDLRDKGIRFAGDFVSFHETTSYGGGSTVYLIMRADGSRVRVPGIGWKRAKGLIDWRSELARRALRRAPTALPLHLVEAIDRETEQKRQDLARRVNAANTDAVRLRNEANEAHRKQKVELGNIEANARQAAATSRKAVETREKKERQSTATRKSEALGPFEREIWQLQSVINPAMHKVDRLRAEYHQLLAGTNAEHIKMCFAVVSLKSEMSRYQNITKKRYLARVFAFARE